MSDNLDAYEQTAEHTTPRVQSWRDIPLFAQQLARRDNLIRRYQRRFPTGERLTRFRGWLV